MTVFQNADTVGEIFQGQPDHKKESHPNMLGWLWRTYTERGM